MDMDKSRTPFRDMKEAFLPEAAPPWASTPDISQAVRTSMKPKRTTVSQLGLQVPQNM
jgi:hypothetical protein